MCSLIICCNPNADVIPSILEPSYVVLLPLNQRVGLALKSPRITVKKVLLAVAASIQNCSQMLQNHLVIGLGNDIKIQIYTIYLLFLSQNWCILVRYIVNIEHLEFLREESFYNKYKHCLV